MIRLHKRHWLMAAILTSILYIGVAGVLLWRSPTPPQTPDTAIGDIEIQLGTAGGIAGVAPAAQSAAIDAAEGDRGASRESTPEPAAEVPTEPEAETSSTPPSAPEPAVETASTADSDQSTESRPIPEPERVTLPESQPAPKSEPEPEPKAEPKPGPESKPASQPKPKPTVLPARKSPSNPTPAPQPRRPTVERISGAPGKLNADDRAGAGRTAAANPRAAQADGRRDDVGNGAGNAASVSSEYIRALQRWLEEHKQYPRAARSRRQEGVVLLYFVMDREGQVLRHEIRQSSGHKLLDREAESMIERAQPLPKLPSSVVQAQLELVVPVRFVLR